MKNALTILLLSFICILGGYAQQGSEIPRLESFYRTLESKVATDIPSAPLIGVSSKSQSDLVGISHNYTNAIIKAGGAPVLIPVTTNDKVLHALISSLDGLVLTGGVDVNPLYYNEEPHQQLRTVDPVRDEYELKLIKLAADRNVPVLGICRGEQLMNIAFGGTLYQDIPAQLDRYVKHLQSMPGEYGSHTISITPGSQLAAIIGTEDLAVNSFHHQSVKDVAPGFRVVATSKDGVVEAIEAWPHKPILGVQWHPEIMTVAGDTTMVKLFRFLVDQAILFRNAEK